MSSARRSLRHGRRVLRNRMGRARFARTALDIDDIPIGSIVVYFAAVPEEIYQFEQWAAVLERVARERTLIVAVAEPDIGRLVRARSGLPVTFTPQGLELERLVERRPTAVLYLNHRMSNFNVLRYPGTAHVYLGHGESDKEASVSHQNLAYDYCFVAGPAARERLAAALPLFDVERRAPMVGRPNLDPAVLRAERPNGLPDAGSRATVLYAPTWEGGLRGMRVGSVATHGEAIATSVLGDRTLRLIYRPHPLTGSLSSATATADRRIREQILAAGAPHFIDTGSYGWVFSISDLAITDVSSVAYDWLTTGRPLIMTMPVVEQARPYASSLEGRTPELPARLAPWAAALVHQALDQPPSDWDELVAHHLGDIKAGASVRRFIDALDAVGGSAGTRTPHGDAARPPAGP